jgi:hypothetical protein
LCILDSDDKKTGCIRAEMRVIEGTIKERMVQNTLIDMVDNAYTEGPLLLPAIEGRDYGHGQEEEGSGPTMDEGLPNMDAHFYHFQKIAELERDLATSRVLVEE